jgi:hypothetical protein
MNNAMQRNNAIKPPLPSCTLASKVRFRSVKPVPIHRFAVGLALLVVLTTTIWAESPAIFELAELPVPTKELLDLINRTPVRWESGVRSEEDQPSENPKLAGETKYVVRYSYACRKTWSVDKSTAELRISVRYLRIVWKSTHRIWLENRPANENFWSDKIVLHELDHLRISSDPRHGERFAQRLIDKSLIVQDVDQDNVVNQEYVDQVVGDHVEKIFRDQTDLIQIRYQELDRVSNHGQRQVPPDSPIAKLLKQASEPTSNSDPGS